MKEQSAYGGEQFAHWTQLLHAAQERMEQADISGGLLIEVAAQHPLIEGKYPNAEFSARLDAAAARYRLECMKGYAVKVYAPGSRHMYDGISDDKRKSDFRLMPSIVFDIITIVLKTLRS